MNRGVMVTRGKPDEEELILSARLVLCGVNRTEICIRNDHDVRMYSTAQRQCREHS